MSEWRAIPGWIGLYEASSDGLIRSLPRKHTKGRVLRVGSNPKGYRIAILSRDGERKGYTVHSLVALAFLGPRPDGMHLAHQDGDKANNAVTNLRYATASENEADKRRHGTQHNVNKTHCPRNHAYTPDNLVATKRGDRRCKTCHREANQRRRLAAKGLTAEARAA